MVLRKRALRTRVSSAINSLARRFARNLQQQIQKDWLSVKTIADVPDGTNLSSHLLGMTANHRRNPGCVGKKKVCFRLSPTIGDIYDFEFSLVDKIWDDRETVKFTNAWNFPHI